MGLFEFLNSRIKGLDWTDMALTKLAVFAFALMIAKLWTPILGLEWHWYLIAWLVFAIKPIYSTFKK
ncbi:MAG: hypothetical protein PHV16_02475 [Candidatus Nanoarchaeia archaeon]|nr:hypothetical protein [Candidatus Nanoarchaeia archaeon]